MHESKHVPARLLGDQAETIAKVAVYSARSPPLKLPIAPIFREISVLLLQYSFSYC
jgi:hypothetical protein